MARFAWLVGAALVAAGSSAQGPTLTVHTGPPVDLRAEHFGVAPLDVAAIGANVDVTAGFARAVHSGDAQGSALLHVTGGAMPVVDLAVAAAANTFAGGSGAAVSAVVDLEVALTTAATVPGMLSVWIQDVPSGGMPAVGVTRVDVDADGTWDVVGNPASPPLFWTYVEFGRSAGPAALRVRIQHTGSVTIGPMDIGDYGSHVIVQWFPNSGAVHSYGPNCGELLFERRAANGAFVFWTSPAATANTWFLVGTVQQTLPLPLPPYCSLLLVIDGFAPWPGGDFVVPYVPLPPGFTVLAQAVTFESPTLTKLSNGLILHVGP